MADTTRPHPRVARQEPPGIRLPLALGTLFVPARLRPANEIGILIHFHGAPWLVELQAARLRRTAAIAIQLGAGSGVYSRAFSDAALFTRLLNEAQEKLGAAWKRPARWDRVTLSSFSAGYGAVRELLKQPEACALIDWCCWPTRCTQATRPAPSRARPMEPFGRLAREAVAGRKTLVITHSEVYPGTFASTTETADYLLAALGLPRRPVLRPGPIGMQQLSKAEAGRFRMLGFAGNPPAADA